MHPDDLKRRGLVAEKPVRVRSEAGSIQVLARPYDKIRAGNVLMYYPEANVLVPRHVDPASKTPAFKNVAVTVEAVQSGAVQIGREHPAAEFAATGSSQGQMRAC
jgi:anaerobic selenocysteine-containing dehydrogenase